MIIGFCGYLGCGKTLGLTYLAYQWFKAGHIIYSNYKLGFEFKPIIDLEDIENMKSGFGSLDELWLWMDARLSASKRNRAISGILLKSRKRKISLGYTAQSFRQVDIRLRHITDVLVLPRMARRNKLCILNFYANPISSRPIMIRKFKTEKYFKLYDTREEIERLDNENNSV